MTYGIIAALDEEIAPLLDEMELLEKRDLYGTAVYIGIVRGKRVAACRCGIATINAALCANALIRECGAGMIVNTGIAGALGKDVSTLDVVVSEDAVFHNRDARLMEKYYPFTSVFKADPDLVRRALEAAAGVRLHGEPVRARLGRVATGDLFINERAVRQEIARRLNPLCVEMEGAAVAQAAHANGCPFVIVRTMSDSADEEADESYDQLIGDASFISASIVLKMLEGEE